MGASCSSATPVSDEDQEQDQEQQQQLPQRRQSEREVAPKDKDKEDEDENPEHHQHQQQQQQQQPTEVSAGRRQQSNISTSSRYLNSLIRGGNTATEHTDSVILQPVRLPSHQSHRLHHQNPNQQQQQQQQLNSGSSGQGPIRYRLEDVRPFASSHFAQLLQEQQQQQEQEEEGTLENDENRYDRSLVQRYLEKSTSLSSSGSGQMGKEGNGPRGKAAITVSKSKLQLGGSSAGRSNLLQSPVKGRGERGRRAAAAVANSSTTSTSTSTTSATSILSNRRSLRGKESVTGKRKPHSRLSVDSEKTIYQCKKKSAAAHSAAAAAKTRAQKQQQQQQPRPPQLPTPLQQQQHNQQQCLSLMAHSRDRVIEQVKSGAQVPTPLVLKVRGYVFQRVVASGAHSTLYQVLTYRMHTQELACKHIHKGAFPPQSQAIMRAFLKEETAILGQVKHDNIVSMLEIITTPTDVYIIMNFAANGTIFDYLYKEWKKPLPETMARRWMRDLMLGLEYLHDRMAIVHRDLKLENFLLTERYDALLSDFGLAVQLKQPQAARLLAVHCGTADYMAPELNVTNHGGAAYHVNPLPADIYAMGVSLFELLNYYRPYALSFSASSHSVLYRQQHRLYQLNRRVVLDLAAQRLLAALLEPVPVKRPKAGEVLAHDWFRGPTAS